jgi:single-stranded-DNA-specific exonuclease
MALDPPQASSRREAFIGAVAAFSPDRPPTVLCHNDADGLSAGAIFARAFARSPFGEARVRLIGRGESAWSDSIQAELLKRPPGGLIVTDLGVRPDPLLPGVPAIIVDHHVPIGLPGPATATVVSGYGAVPTPSSSLLAFQCAEALVGNGAEDLAWLAAVGLIGDFGEKDANADFPEVMALARRGHTAKALREATSLVNAPRRGSAADASPALALLLKARGPEEVSSGEHPETQALRQARDEVRQALDAARRIAPKVKGPVALIRLHSPCQIHALVAQSWVGRLKGQVVIAANTGYREGFVHFAARSGTGRNLIAFLKDHAPETLTDEDQFAQGHERATGGQVTPATWNRFVEKLGFGPEMQAA